MTNKAYGKIEDGKLQFAQDYLVAANGGVVIHPTEALYFAHGYKRVVNTPADPPKGFHAKSFTWCECGTEIVRVWEFEADAPMVRTFSKLKLELALFKFGLLDKLYAFLDANTIPNDFGQTITLRHAYDIANELTEGHELFKPYLAMAQHALGVDDETVEKILAASVMEGRR